MKLRVVGLGVLVSIALVGCANADPAASPSKTASPAPTEAAVPSATPTAPTPTATEAAFDVTCDTILTPEGYASLQEHNLAAREFTGWHTDLQFMLDQGGVVCKWSTNGDVMMVAAQLPMPESDWITKQAELVTAGFTITNDPADGFTNEPDTDSDYNDGGFAWKDGFLYYISSFRHLTDFPAFAG